MLAAPDVAVDIAFEQITAMGARRPHFTLFASKDDPALALSRKLSGEPRLGSIDPDQESCGSPAANQETCRSTLESEGIDVVNLTGVTSEDELHHGTFSKTPQVVELIGRLIARGRLRERIMATTVSAAVGSAASLAVSIGQFLKDNKDTIGVIGTIFSVLWAVFLYFANKREKRVRRRASLPITAASRPAAT